MLATTNDVKYEWTQATQKISMNEPREKYVDQIWRLQHNHVAPPLSLRTALKTTSRMSKCVEYVFM